MRSIWSANTSAAGVQVMSTSQPRSSRVIENGAEQLGSQGIKRRDILEHGEKGLVVNFNETIDDAARV